MGYSLLAHLYPRIKGSQEDVATFSLGYILEQSDALNKAFTKLIGDKKVEKACFDESFVAENLQKGLPAISLCAHSALMTAFGNDAVPSLVFAQQVYAYAKENDVLLCFSTSGNSENVVYAAEAAKAAKITEVEMPPPPPKPSATICAVTVVPMLAP